MLEHNSVPLNFDTFIPSHDPALPDLAATDSQNLADISQDEAFRNALNAMYWTGYWTAVYYVHILLSLLSHADLIPSVVVHRTGLCLKRWMVLTLTTINLRFRV